MMKKLFLSFVMMLMASMAWAQYVVQGGLRFSLDDTNKYAQVEAPESGTYSGVINIPSVVSYGDEDYTVKYIGSSAFKESAVTKVTVPSSVTLILGSAFEGCAKLKEVNLSEGLEDISSYAFQGSAVTSLTIPGTVTRIQSYAMEAMDKLTKLTFAYGTEELAMDWSVFNNTNNVTELVVDRYYTFGNGNGISYSTVKKVTFGEHLTTIPSSVCQGMSLNELNVGANVTAVDSYAFFQCTLPEGYNFPFAQIKEIEDGAFYLTKNLPSNLDLSAVETIEGMSFANCEMKTVNLGSSLTTLGEGAFNYCDQLTSVNIPGGVNSLTSNTFYGCNKLTNVTFDYSNTALTLEEGTFNYATTLTIDRKISGTTPFSTSEVTKVALGSHMATISSAISSLNLSQYTGLTELELLDGWTEVPYGAFKNLATVTTLTLPEGLETIGQSAFEATGLTAITIPGTMKTIGTDAFKNCPNLTSLTLDYSENISETGWPFGKGVLLFNGTPFSQTNITDFVANRPFKTGGTSTPFTALKRATFGPQVTTINDRMFAGLTLEQLVLSENITDVGNYAFTNCVLPDGVVLPFSKMKKIGTDAFRGCTGLPATIDLSAIEEISSYAFQNCTSIESLIIGGGTIGSQAFSGCTNLSSITLNEGVTEIGSSNFTNLANLATISLPSTLKKIGDSAFNGDANLTIPGGLPNGLEKIGTRAFSGCKKLNVNIPSTVTSIGQGAFSNCESLENVVIPAGVTSLSGSTFNNCNKLTSVTIPGTLTYIGMYDFSCLNLAEVKFEKGTAPLTIGSEYTFYQAPCTKLYIDRIVNGPNSGYIFRNVETVEFGPNCTEVGNYIFKGTSSLKKVTMTDNIKRVGVNAFESAKVDGELTLSKKLETFDTGAFSFLKGQNSLTLPITVNTIAEGAFTANTYNEHIKDFYVPWLTPLVLDDDQDGHQTHFGYLADQTLWVPGGTMDAYKDATIWKKFQRFDYWSFVVSTSVAGKGQVTVKNGEAVTDNGTNTEKKVKNNQLVDAGAGEAVSGLFVREKDLMLTSEAARGYKLSTLTANGTAISPVEGVYTVENLLADQTILATFEPIVYKITYKGLQNATLPEGKENPATYTVEDDAITLVNPTRTGYIFKGWTGTKLTEATMTVTIPANSIGKREYTATWEAIPYAITYDLAGGSVKPANKVEYNIETADFTLTNPTKEGYTFTGWTGTGLSDKTMKVTITKGSYGERAYTATWEANTYKVKYDSNKGNGEMAEQNFVYDVAQALIANAYTRTGYTFKEWNSQADGQGTAYADKQEVKNLTVNDKEVVTLYARWTGNTYKVHFEANGGTGTMNDQKHKYGTTKALTANAFTRAGYVFAGWNTKADGTGKSYANQKEVKNLTAELNGIFNLYAQWKNAGDINGDGKADIADVVMLSNAIQEGKTDSKFDVNGDNEVNAEDVTYLVNYISGVSISE